MFEPPQPWSLPVEITPSSSGPHEVSGSVQKDHQFLSACSWPPHTVLCSPPPQGLAYHLQYYLRLPSNYLRISEFDLCFLMIRVFLRTRRYSCFSYIIIMESKWTLKRSLFLWPIMIMLFLDILIVNILNSTYLNPHRFGNQLREFVLGSIWRPSLWVPKFNLIKEVHSNRSNSCVYTK